MSSILKTTIYVLIAGFALLTAKCIDDPPDSDNLTATQKQPRRPGNTNPNPPDLPPNLEKWIWIGYQDGSPNCGLNAQVYNPPEDFPETDYRVINLNWEDSTYSSDAFIFHYYSNANAPNDWHEAVSGTFSVKPIENKILSFTFSNGLNIYPFFSEWESTGYVGDMEYAYPQHPFAGSYVRLHPEVPFQFVFVGTQKYQGQYDYTLIFIVLNPHTNQLNQQQLTTN